MADEEAAALRAQIAALSGAIDQRRSGPSNHVMGMGRAHERGRGRGARGRTAPRPSRNRSLVLPAEKEGNGPLPSSLLASSASSSEGREASPNQVSGSWVKRKTTHNMSLVSTSAFERAESSRLATFNTSESIGKERRQPQTDLRRGVNEIQDKTNLTSGRKPKPKPAVRRGDNMGEVIIDGVTFEFDKTGARLVKKSEPRAPPLDSREAIETSQPASAEAKIGLAQSITPSRTSVNGQTFVRTKKGNLVSAELLERRTREQGNAEKLRRLNSLSTHLASVQQARNGNRRTDAFATGSHWTPKMAHAGLCAFFNRTGQCKRGLSCPYTHDASKLAICPGILRSSGCTQAPGSCLLSHDPRHERVPHCVHFLKTGMCRNGDACHYIHPSLTSRTAINGRPDNICTEFSKVGWCDKGRDCTNRHTWDCPSFVRYGQCKAKGCRLLHIIRAGPSSETKEEGRNDGREDLQDADLFVRDDDAQHRQYDDDGDEEDEEMVEEEEEEEKEGEEGWSSDAESGSGKKTTLKRGLIDEDNKITCTTQRRKMTREFAGQQDFISFNEADDGKGNNAEDPSTPECASEGE